MSKRLVVHDDLGILRRAGSIANSGQSRFLSFAAAFIEEGSVPWRETDGALIDSSEKIISYSLEKAGDRSFTVGLAGMKMARHSAICRRVRVAQCRTLDFKSPRAPGQILSSPVHLTSRGENQVPVFG